VLGVSYVFTTMIVPEESAFKSALDQC